MTAWEKLWAVGFPSRNSRVANKTTETLFWEVHLLLGRAVGGRSASKGVQVVVYGSMAREDIRVAPFLRKFTFEATLEVRETFERPRPSLTAESVIWLEFTRAYEIFDHHPAVSKKAMTVGDRRRSREGTGREMEEPSDERSQLVVCF